jgi:hypothetical protein
MSVALPDEPILGSLASVNFVNGRVLTGDDLSREQAVNLAAHARLGRAIGDGVVQGLRVTATTRDGRPAIFVESGIGMTRSGRAVALESAATIVLVPEGEAAPTGGGLFAACVPPRPATPGGVPLLLVALGAAPGQPRGRAQVASLGNEAAPCAVDVLVEALRVRLVPFAIDAGTLSHTRARSRAAALLLGSTGPDAPTLADDPLGPGANRGGLLSRLRAECLTDHEIPLAILSWPTADRIAFCDRWAVRRRVMAPAAAGDWRGLAGVELDALAEARLLQFTEQMADILAAGRAGATVAKTELTHLPPAGLLPVGPRAFDSATFFRGLPAHSVRWVEGAKLAGLLRAAAAVPPIDLDAAAPEAIWRYFIRSATAAKTPEVPGAGTTQLLFVSGHVPYAANAQWDLAHFDQANYAI